MILKVVGGDSKGGAPFTWIDVVEPTRDELTELAAKYGLHLTSVEDSLQPEHLPKYEAIEQTQFLILRAYDEACAPHAATPQQLTRKVALFLGDKVLISIHRQDQGCVQRVREAWKGRPLKAGSMAHVVNDLMRGVVDSYEKPIAALQKRLTEMEATVFEGTSDDRLLQDGYQLRRRAGVILHILSLTSDVIPRLGALPHASKPFFQDVAEKAQRLAFYANDIQDNVDSLLNLHMSIAAQATNRASHKVNEVMRLLTVFSAFFLPLSFIAGVYGMNFENMPELHTRYGYHGALIAMALTAAGIFFWFKRKGWLKGED